MKNRHCYIPFTNEIFCIEEKVNWQNDRVLVKNCYKAQKWAAHACNGLVAVSYYGVIKIHFCEVKVNTDLKVYCSMLDSIIESLNDTLSESHNWCFLQDSALSHKAKRRQTWSTEHISDLITSSDWLAASSNLNPLDCLLWHSLEGSTYRWQHLNLDCLKAVIVKHAMPIETICAAIDAWATRLKACMQHCGNHFE